MKNCNAPENQTTRRILLIACATALAVAFTVSLPQPAHADHVTPPPVPANIQVPAGNKAFLEGHAVGTQNYVCVPCPTRHRCVPSGFAWILFTPQATLFDDDDKQVITHFFSPNPYESNTNQGSGRWHDSRHVAALAGHEHRLGQWRCASSSSDPAFVAPGAIPWLLLEVVGAQDGPTGGDTLTATTFIQRLNTSGGVAPSTGCASSTDVGKKAFVPYTADYFFYN